MRRILRKKMQAPVIIGTNELASRRLEQGLEMTPVRKPSTACLLPSFDELILSPGRSQGHPRDHESQR